jgi:hypothetical protein
MPRKYVFVGDPGNMIYAHYGYLHKYTKASWLAMGLPNVKKEPATQHRGTEDFLPELLIV